MKSWNNKNWLFTKNCSNNLRFFALVSFYFFKFYRDFFDNGFKIFDLTDT